MPDRWWYYPFTPTTQSTLAKKFVSTTAVTDYGNTQAITVAPTRAWGTTLAVGNITLLNRSGGTVATGMAVRYKVGTWHAGQVSAAEAYTDDTTDAQNATTGDFVMHDRTDSGSGFLVGAAEPFDILGIVQSAAGDQTAPTKIIEYWNGSAWVDIVATLLINDTLIGSGTGEKVLWWPLPPNWAVGGSGSGPIHQGRYNLRIRHTHSGAGTANPVASQLFVGRTLVTVPSLGNNAIASQAQDYVLRGPSSGEALFPVFSVASALNTISVAFRYEEP